MATPSLVALPIPRLRPHGVAIALLTTVACAPDAIVTTPPPGANSIAPGASRATTSSSRPSRWEELPPLPFPLSDHGLVVFRDCVWSIGGRSTFGLTPTDAVFRYCPDRDATRWVAAPPLPEAMSSFVGVGALGDRIYVAGGIDAQGAARRTVYAYTSGAGWATLADSLPVRMACGGGVTLEGRLIVYGGLPWTDYVPTCDYRRRANELMIFDPTRPTGTRWLRVGPSPSADIVCGYRLAAVNRQVHLVGGGDCNSYDPYPHHYAFDVATRTWVPTPWTSRGMLWPGVVTVGQVVVTFGGTDDAYWYSVDREAFAIDLASNSGGPLPLLPVGKVNAPAVNFRGDVVIAGSGTPGIEPPSSQVLRYRMSAGCDLYEPDDHPANAAPLSLVFDRGGEPWPWKTTLGRICAADDTDYIRIDDFYIGYQGLAFRLTPPTGTDYELALMDLSGSRVLALSARPGNAAESILIPGDDASYLLRVRSQDGSFDRRRPYALEMVK